MPYYEPQPIPTTEAALNNRTVDQLKQLATLLTGGSVPTRKAELVACVLKYLQGSALRDVWNRLDRLQQAAVAEVVHSPTDNYQPDRFVAKYGKEPTWGDGSYYYDFKPSLLNLFFYNNYMPHDLKVQLAQFVPEPEPVTIQSSEATPETLTRTWQKFNAKSGSYDLLTDDIAVTIRETERAAQHDLQDVPWRELEGRGFIAAAECTEIRVPQDAEQQMAYAIAPKRQQFRIAAENPQKLKVVKDLLQKEMGHRILIIGEFIEQLEQIAQLTKLPLITGKTPQRERNRLYEQFRNQELDGLILSRVGNFALDLPDADVLIQVSGKYGSRQEEAQRLGRVLWHISAYS